MGQVKGQAEFNKWKKGVKLTRKQAILAHCYQCNGYEQSGFDCKCKKSCPLYEYHPHKQQKTLRGCTFNGERECDSFMGTKRKGKQILMCNYKNNIIIYKEGVEIPKCKYQNGIHMMNRDRAIKDKRVEVCACCGLEIHYVSTTTN